MLFNKGHQERIRRFMLEDSAYQRALMKNSPWTIRDIMAMKNRDDAVLATPSGGMGDEPPDGGEITKYFTFNQTGNVMVSSTVAEEEKLDPDVKKAFKKAIVFFGAAAAALSKKGKTLYDYDALDQVITSLGIFSALHREDRSFV